MNIASIIVSIKKYKIYLFGQNVVFYLIQLPIILPFRRMHPRIQCLKFTFYPSCGLGKFDKNVSVNLINRQNWFLSFYLVNITASHFTHSTVVQHKLVTQGSFRPLNPQTLCTNTSKMTSRLMAFYGKKQRWYCLLKDTTKKLPYENAISKKN